jgi:hypothetical protein
LADAGAKGDAKGVDQALKDLHDTQEPLSSSAHNAASQIHDPAHQQKVLEALADLDSLLPQQEAAARDLARNPRDAQKKGKLDDINRNIARDLDVVSDSLADAASANTPPISSVPPEVARFAEKEKELANEVAAAASSTPPGDVPRAARDLAQAHSSFAPKAIDAAKSAPNPSAEPHVRRLLEKLEKEDLPRQEGVAKAVSSDQGNPTKKDELRDATNNIGNSLDDILDALGGNELQV